VRSRASREAQPICACRPTLSGCDVVLTEKSVARAAGPSASALPRNPRAAAAVVAARVTSQLSRLADVGDGTAIGGRVATKVMPDFVTKLTQPMDVVLVTATNGKSTVATMLAAALSGHEAPAFNSGGSNMLEGVAMALSERPSATRAVLEVDEMVLGPVARATDAGFVLLMNASREYTRGVSLERTLEHWRSALADPQFRAVVIANADDPVVVEVVEPLAAEGRVVWVAGELQWREDARLCRRCGAANHWVENRMPDWECAGCRLRRPDVDWWLEGGVVHGPQSARAAAGSTLPGRWLSSNMLFAVAAAATMGTAPSEAATAAEEVSDVDGRYRVIDVDGRKVRLFLVKNPASWAEAVSLGAEGTTPIVLAMEAFSMRDQTPGWDVDLAVLRGSRVAVTGQRRLDVAVMLEAADVRYTLVESPVDAVRSMPPGPVHVIANYTAFKDLRRELA
jgi:lipid II isoglutaminyl synthase (glutamine-hydrolysing)